MDKETAINLLEKRLKKKKEVIEFWEDHKTELTVKIKEYLKNLKEEIKAYEMAIKNLQEPKEIILTKNIKARESFELIPWWDEDTKKQCKRIVNKAVMDNLITKLILQDLIKINYKTQGDLIIAEAEIEVLEKKPKEY